MFILFYCKINIVDLNLTFTLQRSFCRFYLFPALHTSTLPKHFPNMEKKLRFVLLAMLFLLITLAYPCWSEPITNIKSLGKVPHEVQRVQLSTFHDNPLIPSDGCEQTYGVMPCTNTVLRNGFLILVYAYCIFWAAKILTDGSEILLEILGPGIIGGLCLLIFSSLPNAIIILGKSD